MAVEDPHSAGLSKRGVHGLVEGPMFGGVRIESDWPSPMLSWVIEGVLLFGWL
jgi:hypothetical protein